VPHVTQEWGRGEWRLALNCNRNSISNWRQHASPAKSVLNINGSDDTNVRYSHHMRQRDSRDQVAVSGYDERLGWDDGGELVGGHGCHFELCFAQDFER
jgi:hypothetical protein